MLRVVSAMLSLTSWLKSPLSPGYSESCSKFRSKAHLQAASQLQLSRAFLKSVAGYSTAPSGGDKGQLSRRAQQGKAEFRGNGDRQECVLVISFMWSTQNESHVRQILAKKEHLLFFQHRKLSALPKENACSQTQTKRVQHA